jgi:hypothetical protein
MLIVSRNGENHGGKHGLVIEATARDGKNSKWRAMAPRHSVTAQLRIGKPSRIAFVVSSPGRLGMSIALCFCTSLSIGQIQAKEDGRF